MESELRTTMQHVLSDAAEATSSLVDQVTVELARVRRLCDDDTLAHARLAEMKRAYHKYWHLFGSPTQDQ